MRRPPLCLLGVLTLNLLSLVIAPTRGAQLVSGLGSLTALLLIILPMLAWRVGAHVADDLPDLSRHSPSTLFMLALPFGVPLLSPWLHPTLAFWRLDHRVGVILAWLIFVLALSRMATGERASRTGRHAFPALTFLFVTWASALWLSVVWDLGVGSLVMSVDRSIVGPCRGNQLLSTFRTWESQPAAEHLFLPWGGPDAFESKTVYANRGYFFLILMYAYVKLVQPLAGSLHAATNLTPFLATFAMLAAFCVLVARSRPPAHAHPARRHLTLFLALGALLTTWRTWSDLLRFNNDNSYPLFASLLLLLWACLAPPARTGAALGVVCLLAALIPLYAPVVILALACVHGRRADSLPNALAANRTLLRIAVAAAAVAGLSYSATQALIWWKGYVGSGSSFLFRSGLDGDVTYFTGILQAFASPCPVNCCGSRSLADLLLPAALPLLASWLIGLRAQRMTRRRLCKQLLVVTAPYSFTLVFFPQAVSIHPYLYDHLLLVPAVVVGSWSTLLPPVQKRLRGAWLLAFLILMAGVIMANLIGIVQAIARVPR